MSPSNPLRLFRKAKITKRWTILAPIGIVLIGLTVIVTAAAVGVHPWSRNLPGKATETTTAHLSAPPLPQKPPSDVTLLIMQLRNGGFVPQEVTGKTGTYEFIIMNASSIDGGTVRLERENGEHVATIPLLKRRNPRKRVRLGPGNYLLRVSKQEDWLSRITIS